MTHHVTRTQSRRLLATIHHTVKVAQLPFHPIGYKVLLLLPSLNDAVMSNFSRKGGNAKKESILELAKLMDAQVRVKCLGGRELKGTLRGYDELVNLVLDECDEYVRGMLSRTLCY